MKIPINLASQPHENLRPLRMAAALAAAAALLLTAVVIQRERQSRNEFRSLTEQIQRLEQELENLEQEQQELQAWLAAPQVQQIREGSAFLNSLILQKSLSWTQLFLDLEKILPARARLTAIRPSRNQSQEAELNLTVAAANMAPLVEFLKNLESSPQFGSPAVGTQRFPSERTPDGNISLDVTTRYQQTPRRIPDPASEITPASGANEATAWVSTVSGRSPEERR